MKYEIFMHFNFGVCRAQVKGIIPVMKELEQLRKILKKYWREWDSNP